MGIPNKLLIQSNNLVWDLSCFPFGSISRIITTPFNKCHFANSSSSAIRIPDGVTEKKSAFIAHKKAYYGLIIFVVPNVD